MPQHVKHATIKPEDCQFDIIVPSHGNLELTITCVKTIYKHTATKFHLIVLDDTQDMTDAFLREFSESKPDMTYVHQAEPYTSGNRIFEDGFALCKTPYTATVMNSVTVEPDWEHMALKLMEKDEKIGIVGFKNLYPEGRIESAGIAMIKWLPTDIGRDQPGHRLSKIYPCDAAQWAFAMVRRKAAQGFIDTTPAPKGFFGFRGWDDIDNCFVVRNRGWKVIYCGLGVGYHVPRATRGDNSEQANLENAANGEYFHKRWGFWEGFQKDRPGHVEQHGPAVHLEGALEPLMKVEVAA